MGSECAVALWVKGSHIPWALIVFTGQKKTHCQRCFKKKKEKYTVGFFNLFTMRNLSEAVGQSARKQHRLDWVLV